MPRVRIEVRSGVHFELGGATSVPDLHVRLLEVAATARQAGDGDFADGLKAAAEAIGMLCTRGDLPRQRLRLLRRGGGR